MTANRRIRLRPYFFEIFAVVNLAIATWFLWESRGLIGSVWGRVIRSTTNILVQALAGVIIRSVVALVRRERAYFRIIASPGWIVDTLRISFFGGMTIFSYGWIKLVVPLYHPRLFDQELWDLDQAIFFGLSPNILFLNLFSHPLALQTISHSYATIFVASMLIAIGYFASSPNRRIRIAFVNGNMIMWAIGAWVYMLVPSLGPAYRFPDVWLAYNEYLRRTIDLQAVLMKNYQDVLRAARGLPHGPLNLLYGIGAFPSMHVAFQTFAFLWFRRLWTWGEILFAIFLLAIFLGSIVTGWHYLIDSIAGLLLAFACYKIPTKAAKVRRFLAIQRRR